MSKNKETLTYIVNEALNDLKECFVYSVLNVAKAAARHQLLQTHETSLITQIGLFCCNSFGLNRKKN